MRRQCPQVKKNSLFEVKYEANEENRMSYENLPWRHEVKNETSGIPGGYRLVSTYDLTHFPNLAGGVYSGVNFGHLKSEVFRNGGVFQSKLWSS